MSSLLWESAGSQSPLPMHKQASGPRACQRLTPPADAFVARTRTYKLQVRLKVLVKRGCHNTPCALSVAYLLAVKAEKSEVTLQFRQERSAERLVQLANDLSGLHTYHGFRILFCTTKRRVKPQRSGTARAALLTVSGAASFIWFSVGVASCWRRATQYLRTRYG